MEIKRAGSQPSQKAPAEHFTGTVRIDPLFQAPAPGRTGGACVTLDGKNVEWMEKVTDEQYRSGEPRPSPATLKLSEQDSVVTTRESIARA
jgi:hypothetical protein